jgi:hypothetical protein
MYHEYDFIMPHRDLLSVIATRANPVQQGVN